MRRKLCLFRYHRLMVPLPPEDGMRRKNLLSPDGKESTLARVIANALDAFIVIDEQGRIVGWSRRAEELFGWLDHEVLGVALADLIIPPHLRQAHSEGIKRYLTTGTKVVLDNRIEVAAQRRDGSTFPVELSVTSIEAGGRTVFSAALRDITDRKKKEDQLRDADRMKDEFLAMLGHELRNPLAPIATAAEILRLGEPDRARVLRASEIISRQVGHMTALINDLLDASRVARGRITLRREAVDLAHVIADAVEQAHSLMEARRHRLEIRQPAQQIEVDADRTRLTQVFGNLLTNAAKYTPEGGHITLSVERRAGEVLVAVRDDGVGIPAAFIPYLFDYFTQGKRTIDRSEGGLGLGLGLVKALVDLHGGKVWAESEGEGKGSSFFVALPALSPRAAGTPLSKQPPAGAQGAALRVMIVDDNVDAATMLAMLIASMGHETAVYHSGAAAIGGAAATSPHLVFLDIGLPDISGYDVAPQIKRLPGMQACVLVALTGYGATEDLERARAAGFDLHLLKPASRQDLLAVVDEVAARAAAS